MKYSYTVHSCKSNTDIVCKFSVINLLTNHSTFDKIMKEYITIPDIKSALLQDLNRNNNSARYKMLRNKKFECSCLTVLYTGLPPHSETVFSVFCQNAFVLPSGRKITAEYSNQHILHISYSML